MKKRITIFLIEIILAAALICACSAGQNVGGTTEDQDDVSIEPDAPEKTDTASENIAPDLDGSGTAVEPGVSQTPDGLPITEPLDMAFYSGAGAWGTLITLNPDGSFVGDYSDADGLTVYVCQFHGQFGEIEKLTDASWLLTLEELELDTGRSVGEEWDEGDNGYTFHYISSEPNGFCGTDNTALKSGAQFILYSPEAAGHEPGTELYGEEEFQLWMHIRREFHSAADTLDCWGLQNMETGSGFFSE